MPRAAAGGGYARDVAQSESAGDPDEDGQAATGARAAYDAVADAYDRALRDELDAKPLDRALLSTLAELAGERGEGPIADVGCGPGHVTRFLAQRHPKVIGLDLSPRMIDIARERAPDLRFAVADMLQLPVRDAAWAGAVALYSVIHLTAQERAAACRELARAVRPGGWLLVAFHVSSEEFTAGQVNRVTEWFGKRIELDGHFLDPDEVAGQLEAAGFTVTARLEREPVIRGEYPSRRCYLLAQRAAPSDSLPSLSLDLH